MIQDMGMKNVSTQNFVTLVMIEILSRQQPRLTWYVMAVNFEILFDAEILTNPLLDHALISKELTLNHQLT